MMLPSLCVHAVDHCNFACQGCSHFAPDLPARVYSAQEYLPTMEKLADWCEVDWIRVAGGEPFLNKGLLEFVRQIAGSRLGARLELLTNGSWLNSATLDKWRPLWEHVDLLHVSLHPELRLEYRQARELLAKIEEHCPVLISEDEYFDLPEFTEKPNRRRTCNISTCTQLLADGRLVRCPVIAYAPASKVSRAFALRRDRAFFDLKTGNRKKLEAWAAGLPQCCQFCSFAHQSGNKVLHQIARP